MGSWKIFFSKRKLLLKGKAKKSPGLSQWAILFPQPTGNESPTPNEKNHKKPEA